MPFVYLKVTSIKKSLAPLFPLTLCQLSALDWNLKLKTGETFLAESARPK